MVLGLRLHQRHVHSLACRISMHNDDSEAAERRERVQALCRDLIGLVTLSVDQRRTLDALLLDLEKLRAEARPRVKVAGKQ
jgi:hypothetical protein